MIKGKGGIFVVTLDGQVIFDKKETGRFPDEGEITKIVKSRRAG
jgi:selenoprotein W-related protein